MDNCIPDDVPKSEDFSDCAEETDVLQKLLCIANRYDRIPPPPPFNYPGHGQRQESCTGWPIKNAPSFEGYHFRKAVDKHLIL